MDSNKKGLRFETKVREDLIKRGFFVSKYHNNVNLSKKQCIPAKPGKFRKMQTGFPDFIAYRKLMAHSYDVIYVEAKKRGYLDFVEKKKAEFFLNNNFCSSFHIAYEGTNPDDRRKKEVRYKEYIPKNKKPRLEDKIEEKNASSD